jgi:hypothetical protein
MKFLKLQDSQETGLHTLVARATDIRNSATEKYGIPPKMMTNYQRIKKNV